MESTSVCCFFFQAEDGIRDLVRSRGLGDVYKRQGYVAAVFKQGAVDDKYHQTGGYVHKTGGETYFQHLSLIHI